jgi:hypothetical protein
MTRVWRTETAGLSTSLHYHPSSEAAGVVRSGRDDKFVAYLEIGGWDGEWQVPQRLKLCPFRLGGLPGGDVFHNATDRALVF